MKVTTGAECSGRRSTVRPLLSSVYSEMAPTVLTKMKPSTLAGVSAARRERAAPRAMNRNGRKRFMREGTLGGPTWRSVPRRQVWSDDLGPGGRNLLPEVGDALLRFAVADRHRVGGGLADEENFLLSARDGG